LLRCMSQVLAHCVGHQTLKFASAFGAIRTGAAGSRRSSPALLTRTGLREGNFAVMHNSVLTHRVIMCGLKAGS
jgi:hypothetical protein